MRVLYLTINPNRVSTTVPTEGWFRVLRAHGLEPVLASTELGAFHDWCRSENIPSTRVRMPTASAFSIRTAVPSLLHLWLLVKRYRIQLIHCNEQDMYPVGYHLARLCGLPVVVSVHFTMDRAYCEWAFGGAKNPARIFFVSEGNREACRASVQGVIPESRWRVLPNGLDLEHFTPDESRCQQFRRDHGLGSFPTVGVACALRPRKQLEHLFQAIRDIDDSRLRVVVAGAAVKGDEEYASALMADAARTLGERLVYVGHLDELRPFYNALDIFVNTSQEEACSISVLESLACGCPVLGYASKSVDSQILPDGGEIVPQDDIPALADGLRSWLSNPDALRARRAGARATAEERFDIKRLSLQLWSEYRAIVPPH